MGEMWCCQIPGFEDHLLSELRRQQQCSKFCDTVLNAEGVSVPAHSCVLSAMSPDISSALSSTSASCAGQRHLLEFHSLGASTLLHLVRLLYSGEMAGETEREKQEAVSAAAKLGIYGLVEVEVTEGRSKNRNKGGVGQCAEVGVQTEAEEREERRESGRDIQTQTEELTAYPEASLEITDVVSFPSSGLMDSHLIFPHMVPFIYPPAENQTPHPCTAPPASIQESPAAGSAVSVVTLPYTSVPYTSLPYFSSQMTQCAAGDPQKQWAGPQGAGKDADWGDERIVQFQDDIPGFISCFLNPDREEGDNGGRSGRRQRAGRVGAGEKSASRPQARPRARGGAQVVQEVRLAKKQSPFLHRWGRAAARVTGQGGGAVGRRLDVKSRELLKTERSRQRRGRGKAWEPSPSADKQPCSKGRGGRKRSTQQLKRDRVPVRSPQKPRATSAASFLTPAQIRHVQPSSGSSPSLWPPPPPRSPPPPPDLLSPASSYEPPAPSLLHTTCLPPPDPPPRQEQSEQIDRLLEEVMMGLDVAANGDPGGARSSRAVASAGNARVQNEQQRDAAGDRTSAEVVVVARRAGCSSSDNGEVPAPQQQCDEDMSDILEHLLQLFEHQFESGGGREEKEADGAVSTETSRPRAVPSQHEKNKTTASHTPHLHDTQHQVRGSESPETGERRPQPRKGRAEETPGKAANKQRKKRRATHYRFSLEKRARTRTRKPPTDAETKATRGRGDQQLQQMPVVKLQRRILLPSQVTLGGNSCRGVEGKLPVKAKIGPLSANGPERNKNRALRETKTYPIRSRLNKSYQVMVNMPVLGAPLLDKEQPSTHKPDRPKEHRRQMNLSVSVSSKPPIQLRSADPRGARGQREKNHERREEASNEEEGALARRGKKRRGEPNGGAHDDAAVAKTLCFDQMTKLSCNKQNKLKQATVAVKEAPDAERLPLTSEEDFQGEKRKEKTVLSEIKLTETQTRLTETSTDVCLTGVEGDVDGSETPTPSHPAKESSVESSGTPEEDVEVDVTGSSSPVPDPVNISWTESSEEDEDVDIEELTLSETCVAVTQVMS
ncbi:uncharacterized protein LOC125008133 [Mugil cephalus]|uniref:uncharacterized protein LOC125008133 n=1 Tax=Mugil cephalus TaxID=48193 RepID=UPI001FB6DACA|nr:uncharacterized protein LOC125008133 [Mugil cephalus]